MLIFFWLQHLKTLFCLTFLKGVGKCFFLTILSDKLFTWAVFVINNVSSMLAFVVVVWCYSNHAGLVIDFSRMSGLTERDSQNFHRAVILDFHSNVWMTKLHMEWSFRSLVWQILFRSFSHKQTIFNIFVILIKTNIKENQSLKSLLHLSMSQVLVYLILHEANQLEMVTRIQPGMPCSDRTSNLPLDIYDLIFSYN